MNKFCVFTKNKSTYFIKRLIEEVGQEVRVFNPWEDFELPESETYLPRTTGVYGSDLDLLMLKSLPQEKVINPLGVLERFRTKPRQFDWMERENFPLLPWIPLKGTDLVTIEKFMRLYPEVIVKPTIGQGGWGVSGHRWEDFKVFWKKKKGVDEDYLMQPFIKETPEFRYFFIKGQRPVVLERKSKSNLAANFQSGGEAVMGSLSSKHEKVLEELAEKSQAHYGAVDFFVRDEELLILELNTVPGVEQLEKVSGLNILQMLLKSL